MIMDLLKKKQQKKTLFAVFIILHIFVPRLFEEKRGDMVFGFQWCVMRGAWFRVCSWYLVSATPPTVWTDPFETLHVF